MQKQSLTGAETLSNSIFLDNSITNVGNLKASGSLIKVVISRKYAFLDNLELI